MGTSHLFLRLQGCNLRCSYCDTPASQAAGREQARIWQQQRSNPMSSAHVLEALLRCDTPLDALSITGGEPCLYPEFLSELILGWQRQTDVPVLLETNGSLVESLDRIEGSISILSADLKTHCWAEDRRPWARLLQLLDRRRSRGRSDVLKIILDTSWFRHRDRLIDWLRERAAQTELVLQPCSAGSVQGTALLDELARVRRAGLHARLIPQIHAMLRIP